MKISPVICFAIVIYSAGCGPAHSPLPYIPTKGETALDNAYQLEKEGKLAEACKIYKSWCQKGGIDGRTGCYYRTRILYKMDNIDKARKISVLFILKFHDSALALPAVKRFARSFEESNQFKQGTEILTELAKKLKGTDLWDSILYEKAKLYKKMGKTAEETQTLSFIVQKGRWGSQLWDNALWRQIEIAQEANDLATEEQYIKKMLEAKESSRLIASYNSPYFDDALFALGHLYIKQKRYNDAFKAFTRLSTWKTSTLKDDGLLWSAKVMYLQNQYKKACKILFKLKKKMADSSSFKKACNLLKEWRCQK